jgi:hypothetical protein
MVARDESDHQRCFDGGHKPPNSNGTSGRKPEPNRDVQHEEGKQCDCRRPTRLPDGRYGHGRSGACPKSSVFLSRHAAIVPQSDRLESVAASGSQHAKDANQHADDYMLAVVLFACSLFFARMTLRLLWRTASLILVGLGWIVFVGTLVWVATLPVQMALYGVPSTTSRIPRHQASSPGRRAPPRLAPQGVLGPGPASEPSACGGERLPPPPRA